MKTFMMLLGQVMAVIRAYKLRTAIAVIGVLLGAMALSTVQNISLALNKKVDENIKNLGDRVVTAYARKPYQPGQLRRGGQVKTLKPADLDAVLTVNNVINVSGTSKGVVKVRYRGTTINTTAAIGATESYFNMRGLVLTSGRIFSEAERKEREKVVVIGSTVAEELFKEIQPIDNTLYINDNPYNVIGVLEEKGSDLNGRSLDNIVIVPLETAMTRIFNRSYLNELLFQLRSWDDYSTVSQDVAMVLRVQHRLHSGMQNDFEIVNPQNEMELSNTLIQLASTLGTAAALIAFFIGGVGIFSLMLLIVNQRTVEIGIKRAIGATKKDILLQFLMESGYIGIMGGILGIIIGILLSLLVSTLASLPYAISLFGSALSFFSALISGVVAGFYPAFRASRVSPVKALRL